jgi:hypothetical protein
LNGAVAQLGERLTGSQEVVGSIPSSSTKFHKKGSAFSPDPFFVFCTSADILEKFAAPFDVDLRDNQSLSAGTNLLFSFGNFWQDDTFLCYKNYLKKKVVFLFFILHARPLLNI